MIGHPEITEAAGTGGLSHDFERVHAVRSVGVCVQDPADICISNELGQFASPSELNLAAALPQLRLDKGKTERLVDVLLGSACDHFLPGMQAAAVEHQPTLRCQ